MCDLLCTFLSGGGCAARLVSSVAAMADQVQCQCLVVTELFTFVGWQEHEISSGCTAAGWPANCTALRVLSLQAPNPQQRSLAGEPNAAQTKISSRWRTRFQRSHGKQPSKIHPQSKSDALAALPSCECQTILGLCRLSAAWMIPFLGHLDTEEGLVLRWSTRKWKFSLRPRQI